MENRSDIPPGTLYMLILKTLARRGAMHGYGIAQSIQQVSEDLLQVEEGSLYPALARFYKLTSMDANNSPGTSRVRPGDGSDRTGDRVRMKETLRRVCFYCIEPSSRA